MREIKFKGGERHGKHVSPIFATEDDAQRFAEELLAEDSGGREVRDDER